MTENPNKETLDQNSQEPEGPAEETTAETTADNPQPDVAEAAAADGAQGTAAPAQTPAEEIAELKDKLLRSLAENENQIRRARRDREDATKYAAANFARDMLGVADNIRRAMEAVPDGLNQEDAAVKAFLDGIALTERELLTTLERHGITKIFPMGENFDHNRHEALFEVPTDDADPGTVMQVVEEGYIIHDRLLRAARVGVAKALAPPSPPSEDDDGHQVDTTA